LSAVVRILLYGIDPHGALRIERTADPSDEQQERDQLGNWNWSWELELELELGIGSWKLGIVDVTGDAYRKQVSDHEDPR